MGENRLAMIREVKQNMLDGSIYIRKNVGRVDRAVRLALGTALVILPLLDDRPQRRKLLMAAIGGSTILEGIIRY